MCSCWFHAKLIIWANLQVRDISDDLHDRLRRHARENNCTISAACLPPWNGNWQGGSGASVWPSAHRSLAAWDDWQGRPGLGIVVQSVRTRLHKDRPCVLVVVGATADGHKELLAIQDGERESHLSWLHLLQDLKARGLQEHAFLAVADGALGFWKALEEALPGARAQQCWVHKTANVLDKLSQRVEILSNVVDEGRSSIGRDGAAEESVSV